ncbi:S-adenosyl-L-methionine-dependent methyltransferase [Cucurbitaria berberidis CBS 394.84]|uniref:rRNA adenine N(6)-methyltransferase n=1 Tax=Cucurbitaria berberidis CBS 394.84 TaxID=1168544 RepID=A0A9P4GDM9_9PLEO|nr:S-adenosyl-L-methionine-dependent methyltransferase [Cucurbitaria berberidis CBS 394.84]KAF1844003.1 S-adenosyl-L-methionine-dependent methyltransferase [Cucurbitaria berberidis CBS 394.84]
MFRIRSSISRITCRPSASIRRPSQTRFATNKHAGSTGRKKGQKVHWSDEKLQTSEKFPLSLALNEVIHPSLEPKIKRRPSTSSLSLSSSGHVRTQIVSPDLCDDVLKYIGHTLEKHKGCDILDINPGAGLWSRKLHDFLQPRSHVLLEPRHDRFQSFLDPLLTAPDSKYSLIVKDPCELDTYRTMVADGVFPHQTRRDAKDPKAQEHNNTLLVTGSLVWDPRLPGLGFDSMAKQLFHHFTSAASSHDLFHAFGLVRTLLWVQRDDFSGMIAESVSGMQKANRILEMTHDINVVVNPERTHRKLGRGSTAREPQYEIESTIRALEAGRKKGMDPPPHRRELMYDFAVDLKETFESTGVIRSGVIQEYLHRQQLAGKSTAGLLQESFVEHYDREKFIRDEYPEVNLEQVMAAPGTKAVPKPKLTDHPAKDEISKFSKKRSNIWNVLKIKGDVEAIADIGEALYYLECKILEMGDGPEKDSLMKKLEDLDQTWQRGVDNIALNYASTPLAETDDRLAMRALPYPRLQWDYRPFEPLIMSPLEVWPQNRLSLISAEPIPKAAFQDLDWFEWVQDFVYGLYRQPAMSISHALDKMQHGLSDIVKDCPTLRDPEKGGRLLMHHLRVRMLTIEMIEELVRVYRDWPFKAPASNHNKYFRYGIVRQGPVE